MDLGIADRVALVCASTSGLGLGVATALAEEGVRVAVTGRHQESVAEVASGLPGAVGLVCDLSDQAQVRTLAARVRERCGRGIDILVLNGAGPPPGTADSLDDATLTAALEQLLRGHRQLVADVLPGMKEQGWGRILAVGSSGVVEPIVDLAASNIGRAALAAYLKSLAAVVAPDGITCNMILPGRIDTPRIQQLDRKRAEATATSAEEVAAASQAGIPAGRYGTTEEFGRTAAFLCSVPASYITGSRIRVDGGLARSY